MRATTFKLTSNEKLEFTRRELLAEIKVADKKIKRLEFFTQLHKN